MQARQAARRARAVHHVRGDPAQHHAADHRRGDGAARLRDLHDRRASRSSASGCSRPRPTGRSTSPPVPELQRHFHGGVLAGRCSSRRSRSSRLCVAVATARRLPPAGDRPVSAARRPSRRARRDAPRSRFDDLERRLPRARAPGAQVLRGVSFTVERGEAYGLVGESGCGKSTTAFAAIRYLPRNGRVTLGLDHRRRRGRARAVGQRPAALSRATSVSMVYQDPGTALNPSIRVGQAADRGLHRARLETAARRSERSLAMLRAGADRRPGVGHAALPAPALGRHAAARRDRHGARRRPRAAGARRADDRPRRHGRGRGARPRHASSRPSSTPPCCSSATTSA